MKIGLYGGTFDPIHHGHLILARTAMEQFALDKVVFIPAAISPHKLENAPTPSSIRWEMVQASIAGEAGFEADDVEMVRSRPTVFEGITSYPPMKSITPSFTYDTAALYRERFPKAELFYFIGNDNLAKLHTWHRIEELKQLVNLLVMDRGDSKTTHPFPKITRRFDISASEIRNRVANGLSIRYLVTTPVADIIQQHQLYQNLSY